LTIKIIAILIGGLIFSFLGFYICKFYKWKSIKGYILLIIGLLLIYIPTFGSLSKSNEHIKEIQKIDSNKVQSIIIKPTSDSSRKKISLITIEKIITDKKLIREICKSLRKSHIVGDGFMKNPEKVCSIQINMWNKSRIILGLKFSEQTTCVTVDSNGESGWHYGNLEAIELGNIITQIIK
jgi:hypothetical protein